MNIKIIEGGAQALRYSGPRALKVPSSPLANILPSTTRPGRA